MDGAVSAPELIQGPRDAWHLLAPIGRGGTARTFKARRVSDDAIQLVKLLEVMPPEQVLGQAEPASDLYALGVTIACVAARAAPDALPFDRRGGRIAIGLIAGLPERLRPLVTDLTHPALDRRCGDAATASERLQSARAGPPGSMGPGAKPRRAKASRRPAAPAPAIAASPSAASGPTEASVPQTRDGRIPMARLIGFIVLCVGMATMVVSGFIESLAVTLVGLVLMVGGSGSRISASFRRRSHGATVPYSIAERFDMTRPGCHRLESVPQESRRSERLDRPARP